MESITSSQPSPFLGKVVEICIVTPNIQKTIQSLTNLGLPPFKIFSFNAATVTNRTFRGSSSDFELLVAFADTGDMVWELMQPVSGPSLMREFLNRQPEGGIHHVAFDCNHVPQEKRRGEFGKRGYGVVQEGIWHGKKGTCEFVFYDTEGAVGTCFESYTFSDDWEEPDEVDLATLTEEQLNLGSATIENSKE